MNNYTINHLNSYHSVRLHLRISTEAGVLLMNEEIQRHAGPDVDITTIRDKYVEMLDNGTYRHEDYTSRMHDMADKYIGRRVDFGLALREFLS